MRWVTCQRASAALPDRRNFWGDGHLIAMGFEGSSYRGGSPIFSFAYSVAAKARVAFWGRVLFEALLRCDVRNSHAPFGRNEKWEGLLKGPM